MPSWKKIIVSGSNAELNQLTATSYGGNISGSATSTGSFGVLKLDKFNGGIGASTNTLYGVDAGGSIDDSVITETAIGYQALKDNANAGANTAVGSYALWQYNGSTGRNTAVGLKAGWNLTGGYRGTYIGWEAEAGGANNIGEIVIGYSVTGKGSNTAVIGGGNITDIYMSSDVGAKLHTGDVSGSLTSTGSFGHIKTPGGIDAVGPFTFQTTAAANDTIFKTAGTSGKPLTLKNSNDSAVIDFQTNGDVANILMSNNSKNNLLKLSADGLTETRGQVGSAHADGNLELYSNNGLNNLILSASMTTISGSGDTTLDVKGKLLGDGSGLTGIVTDLSSDTTPQLGGNLDLNSNNITGTGNIDILGNITAQNFIVSSSVTSIEYQSLSGSTIFGDDLGDTHQFTGSINVSGSVNLDKNSHFQIIQPGGGIFKILTTGNQTSIEGGNISLTSGQGLRGTKFQSNEINTYSNSYDAIDIGEGYIGGTGMRWGYVEILSNSSKTFTAGEAQLTVAPNSGSFEGIKIVGNEDQAADYLRIQSGSQDILNITHNGSVSGSATSTGSFGKLLGDGSSLTGVSSNVVDDTSPQLGGDLDLNSNDITGTGNIKMVGTHQITGSLNISGSSDPLTVNSAGSNGIGLLLQGDVVSQTPLIKFKSAGGNLPSGGTIGFTNGGFQFTSTVTSTGTINANGGFNTSQRGSQNAIESGNGGNAGIGFTGLGGNAGIDFQTSDTTRLDIAVDGTITISGNTVIGGDLTVNGDTTTISTSNILVQDAFGFFATGSAGTNVDAGIIVQSGSFVDSGSAIYHDISKERWSVGKGIASTATNVPDSKWGGFVATVYTASASPVGSSPKYGVGEIHVDDDGEIYIYS